MGGKAELEKEAFLSMARAFGLDINDPHIEELYAYVQRIFPALKRIEELDLMDMEPMILPIPSKS
jgi:Asp-tRNA(Asn)/Glu-tRNA(Gln) amidotransferase C subunit